MNDSETYERIESYFNGKLPASERSAFEKQMEEDAAFLKIVKQHQFANLLIKKNSLLAIKDLVIKKDQLAERNTRIKKAIVVASVLLLSGLALLWFSKNQSAGPPPVPALPKTEKLQSRLATPNEIQQAIVAQKKFKAKSSSYHSTKETIQPNMDKVMEAHPTLPTIPETPVNVRQSPLSTPELIHGKKELPAQASALPYNYCEKVALVAQVQTTPSCEGGQTGSIHVSGFKGGNSPYHFIVLEDGESVSSPLKVAAGSYTVLIIDAAGCKKTLDSILVKAQDCQTDYSFNPFNGEVWEIPHYVSNGTLTVYDELGNVYFRSEIGAEARTTWSGYSVNGELKTGYFPFVINYQDGASKQGAVSIGK